ncbi:nucleotidyltransferase family protein [Methylomicrobium sp. RS1]|uniref:nucleotidyltransferase family protein n=1 Tax=Candidatus Methylomicrobium oryzae TaxID=2802053 RepID=UPI00192430CC|nr:nucleotidyltransferase family protein [Methylomicrobium sp. RS1]MBL1262508.1 nucleotidyltransferase family protein [Methylomicrobium sp. RS1]
MAEPYSNVYALILAAGGSTRMGQPKQLLRWQGRSLLERAIESACRVLPERVFVVVGAHELQIRAAINLDMVATVRNPDWQAGIASSIRCGINALPASAEAVLLMLCDQPLVGSTHLAALLNARRNEPDLIIVSQYHLSCGVPVLFPAAYFERLRSLTGDKGAKPLLREFEPRVLKIPLAEAGLDIDTPGDFEQLTGQAWAEE